MHTIDKHQIVSLLFDGLINALIDARGALSRKDVPAKCGAASKALRILQEGLLAGVDKVEGGDLAQNLAALYEYCANRLILANARNDDALFLEVQGLIEPLAKSWKAMNQKSTDAVATTSKVAPDVPDISAFVAQTLNGRLGAYSNFSLAGA
jgi:flagellar protein FliS